VEDFTSFKPDIIGFSVVTSPSVDTSIALSRNFKGIQPGVKIVWGGSHPSILPEQALAEDYIDYVVIGAGEYTLLELVDHLDNGQYNLDEIRGLAYKKNGRITINEPRPFIKNLDDLPDPAWHLVDVGRYWDITLNSSRGCPYRCSFCYNDAFHKGYRGDFSAERIVAQIEYLQEHYGVKYLKLWEDNFAFDNEKLHRFCNLLLEKNIKLNWDAEARATLTEEQIELMARSGCVSVGLGMEGGSQRLLDFMKKDALVEEMEETFQLLVKHKILPRLYIVHGLPTETVADFEMTRQLLKRLDYPPYTYMQYVPYPGTTMMQYCVDNKLIDPPQKLEEWGSFTTIAATSSNLSDVPKEMIDEATGNFRRAYAIRTIRFAFKHNRSYLWSLLRSPSELWRTMHNLIKYYLMVLFNKQQEDPTAKQV
jgi:radical SAM superfamily enzyme YgiQ (UPF0313 family)